MEDAREIKQELWIVLQDMKRAFDSVSWEMLQKAMRRIRIPEEYITLYRNIYTKRSNRVLTAFGVTKSYEVGDGLDQGGVESPLHWQIFYDPLLQEVGEMTKHGYVMRAQWTTNIKTEEKTELTHCISHAAFVDDTTWAARGRGEMQTILRTATEFFKINDIEVNTNKTKVITINATAENRRKSLTFGDQNAKLKILKANEGTRILGVWFSEDGRLATHKAKLQEKVDNTVDTIKGKRITDKQAAYIIQRVLIPALEYMLNICVLSQQECKNLETKYITLLKHKCGLARSAPNSLINHPSIYAVDPLWTVQARAHIANLHVRLQDQKATGITTKIRLATMQKARWSCIPYRKKPPKKYLNMRIT